MKYYALAALLACTLAAPLSRAADEDDHAGHHPGANEAPEARTKDKMQERMKKMHEQMEKIHASKDPKERQELMQEHMESMREGMKAMHGMGKKPKGECPEDEAGGEAAEKGGMMGGMMMKKHKAMVERLDAMQKMMEQMLEHEAAEQDMERYK